MIFEIFTSRLKQVFAKARRAIDWSNFKMNILPIEDIQALRNEIIYTNRNAFVANPSYTPDSYPWGGGCAYFCPWLKHVKTTPMENMKVNSQRALLHTRDVTPFAQLIEVGGMPFIPSFCDISLGESMFRDARSYFNSLTRNAEAFSQIASRLKDTIFLTDEELYAVICSYINKEYSVKTTSQLSSQQKIDTARRMHFNYNASNQQLRRMLRMDLSILEELFPSVSRHRKCVVVRDARSEPGMTTIFLYYRYYSILILLLYHVFTTGATLHACFEALRETFPPSVRISVATLAYVGTF
jgi:hypothetical protein